MEHDHSKITLHMVSSLDGFIAKKDGSVDWLHSKSQYEKGVTLSEEDIQEYLAGIDCYVMGSKTYEQALNLGWPYGELPVVVLSNRPLKTERENVRFYRGELEYLINNELKPLYKNIWVVGGAMLAKAVLRSKLVNEIIVSIMPVILGDGILFFDYIGQEQLLRLKDVKAYKDGMVELCYVVI